MGVLADYVQRKADQLQAEQRSVEEAGQEWQAAVQQLYARLNTWVAAADGGKGLLRAEIKPGDILQESRLGVYTLDRLVITLGRRASVIAPRARFVVATIKPPGQEPRVADGIVEIRNGVGSAEYYLFRAVGTEVDRWYIQSDARWHADPLGNDVEELTADRFEDAILHILK